LRQPGQDDGRCAADGTAGAMTRKQQIGLAVKALESLPEQSDHAPINIVEQVLDVMADENQRPETVQVTKKARRDYIKALERIKTATKTYVAAGGEPLVLTQQQIDRAIDMETTQTISPPSRSKKEQRKKLAAIEMAHNVLIMRGGTLTISYDGLWHYLATVFYGDLDAKLLRQMRNFIKMRYQIRSRQK
jgi:hypothetical protein